jgi:serine/threonine protein kinase
MGDERLGEYTIHRELGATGPDGVVALKVVHPHLLETPGFFERFMREAHIGQSVLHANVVRTLDCDALEDHHFLVMEYVEGQTLADLLTELERVPEELCRHVAREICKGLAAVHAAGVIHRDLKPENVLITADHVVKVMDLGVARLADEQLRLSKSGAFVGSVECG